MTDLLPSIDGPLAATGAPSPVGVDAALMARFRDLLLLAARLCEVDCAAILVNSTSGPVCLVCHGATVELVPTHLQGEPSTEARLEFVPGRVPGEALSCCVATLIQEEFGPSAGTLCLFASEPRELNQFQRESVDSIARQAGVLLAWNRVVPLIASATGTPGMLPAELFPPSRGYYSLFQSSPVPMWVLNSQTPTLLEVNRAALELFQCSSEEFLALVGVSDLHCAGDCEVSLSRVETSGGKVLDLELRCQKVPFEGERVTLVCATDCTEHLAEQSRHESRLAEVLSISESMSDAFFSLNSDWVVTNVNERALKIWGKSRHQVIGRTFWETFPHLDGTRFEAEYRNAAREGRAVEFEEYFPGPQAWYQVHVTPTVAGLAVYFRDTTEKRGAEAELNSFFSLSLDMLCILGDDGCFKRVNPAFETTLGYKPEELLVVPIMSFVHPDDLPGARAAFDTLSAGARTAEFVLRFRCADGSYKWLSWQASPFNDVLYAAARDVTPVVEAESGLRKSHDELELRVVERTVALAISNRDLIVAKREADEANQAKSEFLSRMSHELRTPLNSILGFGQLLNTPELSPLESESVNFILKAGRHLLTLINEVLNIAQVESGRLELSIEPVAVLEVISEACSLVRPMAGQRGITIVEPSEELGQVHIMADRQRLSQVMINLLSNAIKYNRLEGQVEVTWARRPQERISVEVRDTGFGISPEGLRKLFTAFERLGATNSQVEGSGLGLLLSQRLVRAMGGEIEVASVVDVGSVFSVEFPEALAPLDQMIKSSSGQDEPVLASAVSGRGYTVLCIEDNLSNLRLLQVILDRRPEITLIAAMQGSVGLDLAMQHLPDLVLLDLNLPDMSGKEVLERLRQFTPTREIPVIVISADATPRQIEQLKVAGANAYLTKPLDVRQFLATLDGILVARNP